MNNHFFSSLKIVISFLFSFVLVFLSGAPVAFSLDRAIIVEKMQNKMIRVSEPLTNDFNTFGKEAVAAAKELKDVLDEEKRVLEEGSMTDKKQKHFNAQKLDAIGSFKKVCDTHYSTLQGRFDTFDGVLVESIVETRRVLGDNKNITKFFENQIAEVYQSLEPILDEGEALQQQYEDYGCTQDSTDTKCIDLVEDIKRLANIVIEYESTISELEMENKIASNNELLANNISKMMKDYGPKVSFSMRKSMAQLYTVFLQCEKITKMTQRGGSVGNLQAMADNALLLEGVLKQLSTLSSTMIAQTIQSMGAINTDVYGRAAGSMPASDFFTKRKQK